MKRKRAASADEIRELAAPEYRRAPGTQTQPMLTHVDPVLHARTGGNLDARRIAARLGVPPKRLAPAVGYTPQGLLKNPTSDKLQPALGELAYVLTNLRALLDDERSVSIWLRAPHPDLGGATPLSFMLSGRTAAVIALLHLAESGQTS
jgi:antitoxin Xre/MbcA/ParS-like protein